MSEKKRNVRAPKSIDVIRLRPGQFIGDNSTCDHLIHEALDNALDEVQNGYGDTAGISFSKSGAILVFDNGRGLPCGEAYDEDSGSKKDSVELIFTKLHSGTKFSLDDDHTSKSTGQNGVGNTCINALSEIVDVKTRSKDKIWHYVFKNGELDKKEEISEMKYSTEIIFKPDKKYFGSVVPNYKLFYHRLRLAQAKLPEANFIFNGKPLEKESLEEFARKQLDISDDTPIFNTSYKTKILYKEPGQSKGIRRPVNIDVFLTYEQGDTVVTGDVNLRFCDGTYLNSIQNLIKKILPSKLDKKFQKAPERFLLEGLRLYASLQYPLPGFDSQTKTRLVTNVKSDVIDPMESNISKILGEKHIKSVVEEILSQKLSTTATKKVKKNRISSDNKLRDCINHGDGTTLYIVEGDSAESVLRDCRDTHNEANLPLRGKILNVETSSLVKLGENKEIKNLREALGNPPYRYQYIKQVCDADMDGLHINVLVILIFLKLYPDIIEKGRLRIVLPPLYCAKNKKEFIPIYNVEEFEKYKKDSKYTCQRLKGLGELNAAGMRTILDNGIEYIVKYPKNKKIIDKLLNIITSTSEKQKYLEKLEYNFDDFISELFEQKEG